MGQARTQFFPSHPSTGQKDQYQSQGVAQAPSAIQIGKRDQGMFMLSRLWAKILSLNNNVIFLDKELFVATIFKPQGLKFGRDNIFMSCQIDCRDIILAL